MRERFYRAYLEFFERPSASGAGICSTTYRGRRSAAPTNSEQKAVCAALAPRAIQDSRNGRGLRDGGCGRNQNWTVRPLLVRHQFDPAVLGASFLRLVGGDEVRLPIAVRAQAAFRHAMVH